MAFPFRQPVEDPPEWQPPDYFKPVEESSSSDKWEPPNYFKPIEEEKPKKSVFSVFKRADRIHPTNILDTANKFLTEHPTIGRTARRVLDVTSDTDQVKPTGEALMEVPGTKTLAEKVKNIGERTGNYWGGVAGSVGSDIVSMLGSGFDPRTAGLGPHSPSLKSASEELPIRRPDNYVNKSKEAPYRQGGSVQESAQPQDLSPANRVTREHVADTIEHKRIAQDPTEFAGPSIRQPEAQARDFGYSEQDSQNIPREVSPLPQDVPIQQPVQQPAISAEQPPVRQPVSWNPFEKKASKQPTVDLTEGFGGSGHPESPAYVGKVLKAAGNGEPGLSIEPVSELPGGMPMNSKRIVYRDSKGNPIAVAKTVQDSNGKNFVMDLAADKSQGLLTGRAMKKIGDKLAELGATEPSGTISPDAQNFLNKMKERYTKPSGGTTISSLGAGQGEELLRIAKETGEDIRAAAKRLGFDPTEEELINLYSRMGKPPIGVNQSDDRPSPTRSPNLDPNLFKIGTDSPGSVGKSTEDSLYDIARNKHQMGLERSDESIPKSSTEGWKPPDYFKSVEEAPKESLGGKATSKLQEFEDAAKKRIDDRGTFSGGRLLAGLPVDDLADFAVIGASKIARGAIKFADWSVEMLKEYGNAIKPHLKDIYKAAQDKHEEFIGGAARKLLNSMLEAKGASVEQQIINKAERAKRFAKSASIQEEGVHGAAKSLATMRGEFEKVNPGEGMDLSDDESNMLMTAIKRSKLDEPEKVRARYALFKLFNENSVPEPNELRVLDKVFSKHFSKTGGPGASAGYDINSEAANSFEAAGEKLSKKEPDFLTKLANFSTKSTRAVLGFHVPGTALSFHGFNEAIRNTMFGPDLNPFKVAGRFGNAMYYLARPGKAQEFLNINMGDLGKAIEEGGLKASTGDVAMPSFFKGDNLITRGFNALTNPKPLFGQVIPALKLKGYNGLLAQYEKSGMPHTQAAKLAGEATNNIFGGLNLHELERNPTTQKIFRAAALAPDWLESNVRLGKGMFDAIKHPTDLKNKVYMTGIVNFLGSYIVLNVINALNNDGKFSFQNDVGHELDVATGKDAMGRVRYWSPYGTAMDMVRIPLEIAHAAVEGNMGKVFSDMRSRASEPAQFLTDLMTNTDYAGRSLYDKTKFGKKIPPLGQVANIAGDAAGHFLPIGAESGINLAQGKISPEQFASQVLQMPMKYKFPDRKSNLTLRKLKKLK